MSEIPACACLHVEYDAKHLGSGTYRERWHCRECKREFVPDAVIDKTQARADRAVALLREALNGWEFMMNAYGTPRHAPARERISKARAFLEEQP